jgi:hypothetical protein
VAGGARTLKLGPEGARFGDFACVTVLGFWHRRWGEGLAVLISEYGEIFSFFILIRMEFLRSQQISKHRLYFIFR